MSKIAVCVSDMIDGLISSAFEKDEIKEIADCGVVKILVLSCGKIIVSTVGELGAVIETA